MTKENNMLDEVRVLADKAIGWSHDPQAWAVFRQQFVNKCLVLPVCCR